MKNGARIPTPDATTSNSNEKDNRFNLAPVEMINETMTSSSHLGASTPMSMATGVALIPANLPDLPNQNSTPVTLFLSPIKESDSNSAHSTLQAGTPATNALADWRNSKYYSNIIKIEKKRINNNIYNYSFSSIFFNYSPKQ